MKAILIIAHHCILPGAYKGFEGILDKLHHDLPGTRVASTSLLDLENDLRTLLREDVESVTLLPFLLLNGQHSKNDVPRVVAKLQEEFPQIPITLMPCLGDWKEFSDMVVAGIRNAQEPRSCAPSSSSATESRTSNLFSIELNLEGRNVLVVGGGRIALRKVRTLLPTGAHITVVAPQLDPEFTTIPSIVLKSRPYEPLDLRGIFMVFICTDKPAVNAQVSNDARARRILVNNACDYLDGDFIVPARMDFGENIAVTVSTQGRAPSLAKQLKQKIQSEWAEGLEQVERDFLH
ncbi:MAG: siroheme synthase [Fibrobacter sp.]|nr:siroheme synthase [Fibrobacter sp.]